MINVLDTPIVFCDVETTGSRHQGARVTEVALVRYEQGREVDRFSTLVNPKQHIPAMITRITGIDNTMVRDAPAFGQIAERISDITKDCVFCAHNVNFDFGFISSQLASAGYDYQAKKLCTVLLSRRLYSMHKGHSLGKIIERFGFSFSDRHRALDDTLALVQFAKQIERDFSHDHIRSAIFDGQKAMREQIPVHTRSVKETIVF